MNSRLTRLGVKLCFAAKLARRHQVFVTLEPKQTAAQSVRNELALAGIKSEAVGGDLPVEYRRCAELLSLRADALGTSAMSDTTPKSAEAIKSSLA